MRLAEGPIDFSNWELPRRGWFEFSALPDVASLKCYNDFEYPVHAAAVAAAAAAAAAVAAAAAAH